MVLGFGAEMIHSVIPDHFTL